MVRDDLDPVADAIVHPESFRYLERAVFIGKSVEKELRMRLDPAVPRRARDAAMRVLLRVVANWKALVRAALFWRAVPRSENFTMKRS